MPRIVDPSILPHELWDANQNVLFLPGSLSAAYVALVELNDLSELAMTRDRNQPPVGGLTQQLTELHFAQAFDGSAARALLALLDPLSELHEVSDNFITMLSGNSICVVDAPSGAGATSFAFLTAIAQLRSAQILPRQPLEVRLIFADLSVPARQYADDILSRIRQDLLSQAIVVVEMSMSWDATDNISTTSLVTQIIQQSGDRMKRLVLVSNFNGFLEREKKRTAVEAQLNELFRYSSGEQHLAIWIEPKMNRVTNDGGMFAWIAKLIKTGWRKFTSISDKNEFFTSECDFREPLDPLTNHRVRIAVMPIRLEQGE